MSSRNRDGKNFQSSLGIQPESLSVLHLCTSSALPEIKPKSALSKGSRRGFSACSNSATTELSDQSEEICDSLSDDEQTTLYLGSVPNLSLPTFYEDEENPVTVKITCRKCLDMESILRNFTEMHLKAFSTCKEKRERFWEYLAHWNKKLEENLEQIKSHLIGEFIAHIDQAPLADFKVDHDFRTQFNHYRLLFTHMKSMENRFLQRKTQLECPTFDSHSLQMSDKVLRDLQAKITSASLVLEQLEHKVRSIANSWDSARAATNPYGFRQAIFTKEDYIFNRLSNIFTCIDFLQNERQFYETKAEQDLKTVKRKFLPPLQLKPRQEENPFPKPCNIKRRPQNSVKRKLPSAIAHFYPFAKTEYMDDIHASWFRTFLKPEDIRKEIGKQRDTNMRVLTDIEQLKTEIHQLETQLKVKEYVEQCVKTDPDQGTTFPEKRTESAPGFLDFNSLFK